MVDRGAYFKRAGGFDLSVQQISFFDELFVRGHVGSESWRLVGKESGDSGFLRVYAIWIRLKLARIIMAFGKHSLAQIGIPLKLVDLNYSVEKGNPRWGSCPARCCNASGDCEEDDTFHCLWSISQRSDRNVLLRYREVCHRFFQKM